MRRVVALLTTLPVVMASTSSLAQEPEMVQAEPPPDVVMVPAVRMYMFEAAATGGFATVPIRGGVNPFGAGFGGRLGLNLSHLYLGVALTDYLGGSDNGATDRALLFGGEVGYSGTLGQHLILRPQMGVGDTFLYHREPGAGGGGLTPAAGAPDVVTSASGVTTSTGGGGATTTASATTTVKNIYVTPKLVALLGYDHFFATASVGALIVPGILYGPAPAESTTWVSYTFEAEVGFRL